MMADMIAGEAYGVQLYSSKDGAVYTSGTNYDVYFNSINNIRLHGWWAHLDSPNTESAVTYTVKASSYSSNSITLNDGNNSTQLIVMEIAG